MEYYLLIKALHIISVMAWMAGMLYLPRLFVYHADAKVGSELSETLKVMERRLIRAIINPAMIAAFVFGVWMLVLVPEPRVARPRPQPWRQSLRVLGENRPFRRLIIAYLLNGVAGGLPAGLFFLFVDHVLDAPDRAGLLLVVYFAAAVASLPLWLAASRRFEKRRSWIFAIAIACLAFIWVPLLDAGDVAWFLVICLITGVCLEVDGGRCI